MKRIAAMMLMILALAPGALAQGGVQRFTYGGSYADQLDDLAADADGRIVMTGHTGSTDGTLADRTLTGMAGWALCVDERGEVLWSFCSRMSEEYNAMAFPVIHEDGSVTAILSSEERNWTLREVIRLDAQGAFVSRKTLLRNESDNLADGVIGVLPEGYLLSQRGIRDWSETIALYDHDGNFIWNMDEWSEGLHALGARHVMRSHQGETWLFARGEAGMETPLACTIRRGEEKAYADLISLPDGGAAACGSIETGGKTLGVIARWNAEDKLMSEMIVTAGPLDAIVQTENGFAATCLTDAPDALTGAWSLLLFDGSCVLRSSEEIGTGLFPSQGCPAVRLPDGRIACLLNVQDAQRTEDAQLVIFPAK